MACFVTFYNPLSNRKEMLIFFVKGCALYLIYFNIRLHFDMEKFSFNSILMMMIL